MPLGKQEKSSRSRHLYIQRKKNQTLARRFFLVLHKHKCDPNYFGSLLEEKFIPSGTYWRKSAWKCHHFLSSAGQCHQSHLVSQSHRPAKHREAAQGGFRSVQPLQQPHFWVWLFEKKDCNPKSQKATNASTKKFLFLILKWCRAWNVIYIIGNVSLFLTQSRSSMFLFSLWRILQLIKKLSSQQGIWLLWGNVMSSGLLMLAGVERMAEQEIMLKKQKEIILTEWFYHPCISYTDLQKSQLSKQQEYQG